jgi:hypothetical protein
LHLYSFPIPIQGIFGYFTLLEVSNVIDSLLFEIFLYSVWASLRRDTQYLAFS